MRVVEVTGNLAVLPFPVGQVYMWHDADGVTVIDTGLAGSATAITEVLTGFGVPLRRIVLTHFHEDHAGSAAALRALHGVPVLAHRADAPFVRDPAAAPAPTLTDRDRELYAQITTNLPASPPSEVDEELDDGDVLDFAGGARVISGPGHTDGSIAVHLPEHGVLFTGDTVSNVGSLDVGVFNYDTAGTAESCRQLSTLDFEIACFGHGDPITAHADKALRTRFG